MNHYNQNALNQLLQQVGPKLNIPALSLNNEGKCCLSFGEKSIPIQIQVDEKKPVLHFIALVAETPKDLQSRAKLYEDLLVVNSFATENGGMNFSINSGENRIQIVDSYPIFQLNALDFEEHLNSFLHRADGLSKSLVH